MKEFVSAEGLVHLVSPSQGEYTLCGDAFDLASDITDYEWTPAKSRTVTCASCAAIIVHCRGVKVDPVE